MNFKTFAEKFSVLADAKADYEALENRCKSLETQLAELKQTISKSGYSVQQTSEGVFELIKDETTTIPQGDYTNPIPYEEGMECKIALFYTDGEDIWECIKNGTPDGFSDKEYFDIIEF